jgi:hypothetical protein
LSVDRLESKLSTSNFPHSIAGSHRAAHVVHAAEAWATYAVYVGMRNDSPYTVQVQLSSKPGPQWVTLGPGAARSLYKEFNVDLSVPYTPYPMPIAIRYQGVTRFSTVSVNGFITPSTMANLSAGGRIFKRSPGIVGFQNF